MTYFVVDGSPFANEDTFLDLCGVVGSLLISSRADYMQPFSTTNMIKLCSIFP
jgi:hypothetical protein